MSIFSRGGKTILKRHIDGRDIVIRRIGKRGNFIGYRLEDRKPNIDVGAASIGYLAKSDTNAMKMFGKKYAKYKRMLHL